MAGTSQAGLGDLSLRQQRGWCRWLCVAAWAPEELGAVSLVRDRRVRGEGGYYGNVPNGRVPGCQLLDCSAAPVLGVSRTASFCLLREGRGDTPWKRREERVIETWRASAQMDLLAVGFPDPFPGDQLETGTLTPHPFPALSGDDEATLEIKRTPSRAAALHSQSCHPHWFPVSAPPPPHPQLLSASLPKMGALEQRSQFLLPLFVPHFRQPPPFPRPPLQRQPRK